MDISGDGKKKKFNIVHCRVCKEEIDRNIDPDGKTWIMASKNYFYHKTCYDSWKKAKYSNDDDYIDLIYDFIARDLKASYDYYMCEAQRKKFIKENQMTNKGILFALKYFYEVKHGVWEKGHGGIGIIPFIYTDACAYWAAQERKSKGIIAEIERQMREAAGQTKHAVIKKEIKPKKFKVDLSLIADMEDDE